MVSLNQTRTLKLKKTNSTAERSALEGNAETRNHSFNSLEDGDRKNDTGEAAATQRIADPSKIYKYSEREAGCSTSSREIGNEPIGKKINTINMAASNTLSNLHACVAEFDKDQTPDVYNMSKHFNSWLENFEAVCE